MVLATQLVTIAALGLALILAGVRLIGFLLSKNGEINRALWQIPLDVESIDRNMRTGFNIVKDSPSEEKMTLERILALTESDIAKMYETGATGLYRDVIQVKERHDRFIWWSRIFWSKPKPWRTGNESES